MIDLFYISLKTCRARRQKNLIKHREEECCIFASLEFKKWRALLLKSGKYFEMETTPGHIDRLILLSERLENINEGLRTQSENLEQLLQGVQETNALTSSWITLWSKSSSSPPSRKQTYPQKASR